MSSLSTSNRGFNLRFDSYFDKIAFRTSRLVSKRQGTLLRENTDYFDCRKGHPIRGSDAEWLLTLVNPNEKALQLLDKLDGFLNYLENACDLICPDNISKLYLRDKFDHCFVQRWHGNQEVVLLENGTYTGQAMASHRFLWYPDRASKRSGDPHCLHVEGRHKGLDAVRRLGIEGPKDLIEFDHDAFWRRNMRLYEIDFERLGRLHLNRISGQRRKSTWTKKYKSYEYNIDRRTGAMLFHVLAVHPKQAARSVQRFIDCYGSGPFLRQVDFASLFSADSDSFYCLYPTKPHVPAAP